MSRQISDCATRDEELVRQLLWVEHDAEMLADCADNSKRLYDLRERSIKLPQFLVAVRLPALPERGK